jgi:site-specific DNA-methyltransferase (adenine-specific)
MIELIRGDSFRLIKHVADNSIPLVMTDVPYPDMKIHDGSKDVIPSDQWVEWFSPLAYEILRVLSPTGSFVTTINSKKDRSFYFKFAHWMTTVGGFEYALTHYWVKQNIIPGDVGKMPFPRDAVDPILWFVKTKGYACDLTVIDDWGRYNPHHPKIPTNMIYASVNDDTAYRAAKKDTGIDHTGKYPQLIPEFFIRILTNEGDLVLEPFAGSGTTPIAAGLLNRPCLAFEKNLSNITLAQAGFEAAEIHCELEDEADWRGGPVGMVE